MALNKEGGVTKMLFKPELCQAILDGQKGQTRRLVKPNETARILDRIGRKIIGVWVAQYDRPPPPEIFGSTQILQQLYRRKWIVGRTYAIQPGRGKEAVGRFLLTGIRRERLQDISGEDAQAEGVVLKTRRDGMAGWVSPACPGILDIRTRYAFKRLWDNIHPRRERWADNCEVWVLELEAVNAPEQ